MSAIGTLVKGAGQATRPAAKRGRRKPIVPPVLTRADAGLTRSVRTARQRVQRAQQQLPERPTPAIPTLARPTRRQAQAAVDLSRRSLQGQVPRNVSRADRAGRIVTVQRELRQDPRTASRLRPVDQAQAKLVKDARVKTGLHVLRERPGAFGLSGGQVEQIRRRAAQGALPGALRSTLEGVGRSVERAPVAAKAGRGDRTVGFSGLATVNVDALRRSALAATSLNTGDLGPKNLVKRSLADVGTLGTAPVLAGYQAARGVWDLAHGRPQRLGALAGGIASGVKQEVLHPGRALSQHPLLTTLDAAAALTVGGRVAGAVTRGLSGGRLASTVRPPLALVDDAGSRLVQERRYSRDLVRQTLQKAADARRAPLLDVKGRPVTREVAGRRVPVLRAQEGVTGERSRLLRRQANFAASQADSVNRLVREVETRDGTVRGGRGGIHGRDARDVVAMVAEGTILTGDSFARDLAAHGRRLADEIARRDGRAGRTGGWGNAAQRAAAHERLATVQRILASPKVTRQAQRIAERGIEAGARLRARDAVSVDAGVLRRGAAERAPLMATAIEHMGARHFTVAEHRVLEKAAVSRERAAAAAVKAAGSPAERRAAQTALSVARRERYAVSGRHPQLLRQHEQARADVTVVKDKLERAREAERTAVQARQRVLGGQASRRGSRHAEVGIGRPGARPGARATQAEQAKLAAVTRQVEAARAARLRLEKEHRRAVQRVREAPLPDTKAGLRRADGRYLSNRDIEEFLRSQGRDPQTVAKLPHVLPQETERFGARANYQQHRVDQRPLEGKEATTGELYRMGASSATAGLLRDAGVRQVTQIARARQVDRFIGEAGLRHPAWTKAQAGEALSKTEQRIVDKGGYFTGREAKALTRKLELEHPDQMFVAVRGFAASLPRSVREMIAGERQGPAGMETLPQQLLNGRVVADEELGKHGARNIVLVPRELFDQMNAHLQPPGPIEKFFQLLNRPFRMAVLPQPRWLVGNFAEPYFVRLPGVGSGVVNVPGLVRDIVLTNRAVRNLRRRAADTSLGKAAREQAGHLADQIEGHQLGGLFIGRRGASNYRTRDDFKAWGRLVKTLPVMEDVGNAMAASYRFLTLPLEQLFKVNRKWIESPAQKAAFGKLLRGDMQELTGSWVKAMRAQHAALNDALDGLVGTPAQERFMRAQHELLGKYEGFGPVTRRLVQSIAPFLPWALSAARFVYWTMPMHRTAQTALLVHTQAVMQTAWDSEHQDVKSLPGALRYAARSKGGGLVDFARYTPYGFTAPVVGGDPQGVTDQFMPQLSGFVAAFGGKDPFGRDLKVKPTAGNPQGRASLGQKLGIGAYGLAEALVPYLASARRLQEHGETAFSDSTVFAPRTKPGTGHGMSAVRRTLDPLRPVFLRSGATTLKAGASGGGQSVLDRVNAHRGSVPQAAPADVGELLDAINRHR